MEAKSKARREVLKKLVALGPAIAVAGLSANPRTARAASFSEDVTIQGNLIVLPGTGGAGPGYVGIGTTPQRALHMRGDYARFDYDGVAFAELIPRPSGLGIETASGMNISFAPAGSTRMVLTAAGHLGLGTASPSNLLHLHFIGTSGQPRIRLEGYDPNIVFKKTDNARTASISFQNASGGDQMSFDQVSGAFRFRDYANEPVSIWTNGSERLTLTGAGNVGIGTSTPAYALDVVGDIHLTGVLEGVARSSYFDY